MSSEKTKRTRQTAQEKAQKVLAKAGKVASLGDLIPEGPDTKMIELPSADDPSKMIRIKIKKLKMDDLAAVGKYAKEDPFTTIMGYVSRGVVDPVIGIGEVKQIPANICIELSRQIIEFSGLREEDLESAKNLSEPDMDSDTGI